MDKSQSKRTVLELVKEIKRRGSDTKFFFFAADAMMAACFFSKLFSVSDPIATTIVSLNIIAILILIRSLYKFNTTIDVFQAIRSFYFRGRGGKAAFTIVNSTNGCKLFELGGKFVMENLKSINKNSLVLLSLSIMYLFLIIANAFAIL